jgi:hypothetical protein
MSVGIVVPRERDASLPSEAPGLQTTRRSATWSPRPTGSTGASSRPRPIRATSPTCSTSTGTLTTGSCSSRRCADESSDPLPSIRTAPSRASAGQSAGPRPRPRGAPGRSRCGRRQGITHHLRAHCTQRRGARVRIPYRQLHDRGDRLVREVRVSPGARVRCRSECSLRNRARALPATALTYLRYLSTAAARPGHSRCTHHEDHAPQRARPVGCGRSRNTDGEIESHQPFPIGGNP